ncbi:MAG TPA: hypothetical protein VEL28_12940 [Candidatus Binatia bacterium]|nr:hypothetical protein [Candidatus Binatia bacterium]
MWSRFWGAAAAVAFWVHVGAAVYEAAVVAPQWAASPPQSVRAWNQSGVRPEAAHLLTPLAALAVAATTLAWLSSLRVRSSRRWWLTLTQACALGLGWIVIVGLMPAERGLRGAGLSDIAIVELTGEWVRWSAARLLILLLGAYAAYRGHIVPERPPVMVGSATRRAPARDFVISDDDPDRITFGDD